MNYRLVATQGTATYLADRGISVKEVLKASEGRPNVVDDIKNKNIDLIINTPLGRRARSDEFEIGWAATKYRVPVITTLSAAEAIVRGLKMQRQQPMTYSCLQEYHQK
jgi:carbamoyl-phosphate synthase large subunit